MTTPPPGGYPREHLAQVCAGAAERASAQPNYLPDAYSIHPSAQPPTERWNALMANDEEFAATWHKRRKLRKDNSQSGYDAAIASRCARAGWSDQEIVDTLVAHRRQHEQEGPKRRDYYDRTLARGRTESRQGPSPEREEYRRQVVQDEPGVHAGDPQLLRDLSEWFGGTVHEIIRELRDPPVYYLRMRRMARIGSNLAFNKVGDAVLAAALHPLSPDLSAKKRWYEVLCAITSVARDVDTGPEGMEETETRQWWDDYLSDHTPDLYVPRESHAVSDMTVRHPFSKDGVVYFWPVHFKKWLEQQQGEHVKASDLGSRLHRIGAVYVKHFGLALKDKDQHTVHVRREPTPLPASEE